MVGGVWPGPGQGGATPLAMARLRGTRRHGVEARTVTDGSRAVRAEVAAGRGRWSGVWWIENRPWTVIPNGVFALSPCLCEVCLMAVSVWLQREVPRCSRVCVVRWYVYVGPSAGVVERTARVQSLRFRGAVGRAHTRRERERTACARASRRRAVRASRRCAGVPPAPPAAWRLRVGRACGDYNSSDLFFSFVCVALYPLKLSVATVGIHKRDQPPVL